MLKDNLSFFQNKTSPIEKETAEKTFAGNFDEVSGMSLQPKKGGIKEHLLTPNKALEKENTSKILNEKQDGMVLREIL